MWHTHTRTCGLLPASHRCVRHFSQCGRQQTDVGWRCPLLWVSSHCLLAHRWPPPQTSRCHSLWPHSLCRMRLGNTIDIRKRISQCTYSNLMFKKIKAWSVHGSLRQKRKVANSWLRCRCQWITTMFIMVHPCTWSKLVLTSDLTAILVMLKLILFANMLNVKSPPFYKNAKCYIPSINKHFPIRCKLPFS